MGEPSEPSSCISAEEWTLNVDIIKDGALRDDLLMYYKDEATPQALKHKALVEGASSEQLQQLVDWSKMQLHRLLKLLKRTERHFQNSEGCDGRHLAGG